VTAATRLLARPQLTGDPLTTGQEAPERASSVDLGPQVHQKADSGFRISPLTCVGTPDLNRRPLDPQDGGSQVIAAQGVFFRVCTLFADVRFVQRVAWRVVPKWSPTGYYIHVVDA
jgi:hypothetical protein